MTRAKGLEVNSLIYDVLLGIELVDRYCYGDVCRSGRPLSTWIP